MHGHDGDDGHPDHESCNEPHQDDPQEGNNHGHGQSDQNDPPRIVEILKDPLHHLKSPMTLFNWFIGISFKFDLTCRAFSSSAKIAVPLTRSCTVTGIGVLLKTTSSIADIFGSIGIQRPATVNANQSIDQNLSFQLFF